MVEDSAIQHYVVTFESVKRQEKQKSEMFCKQCDYPVVPNCVDSGSQENRQVSNISEIHSSRHVQIEMPIDAERISSFELHCIKTTIRIIILSAIIFGCVVLLSIVNGFVNLIA
jgi:hypothetical protein